MAHCTLHTEDGSTYSHDANGHRVCTGSLMGRSNTGVLGRDESNRDAPRFYLTRVRIDRQGYDKGGAYWGIGRPLYEYESEDFDDLVQGFLRADDRRDAKAAIREMYPNARFLKH